MSETLWNHRYADSNGIEVHYVRHGAGEPLVLLHGWPEFWYTFRKNIPILSESFDVVAPDIRGFGASEKPPLPDPPGALSGEMARDLLGLADGLGFERFGIVGHDVGAYVAQAFAHKYPERVTGLFFFDCPYPGIGSRWAEPDHLQETWYQYFHQQPWAQDLVGSSREACRVYLRHFLDHWAAEPGHFDEDLELWVDNFLIPGNLRGGFDWYVGTGESRTSLIRDGAPRLPTKIQPPARVLWGAEDPILKVEWADRLGDYFADYRFDPVPGAGHFLHYEQPELANREISSFFSSLR